MQKLNSVMNMYLKKKQNQCILQNHGKAANYNALRMIPQVSQDLSW
jgi:hypothetical protein